MRLLHVVPTYLPARRYGGPIHSVHGLCKALARRGHEVHVATTNVDGDRDSDVPLDKAVDLDGVQVHYFASRTMRRLYYAPGMMRFLSATIPGCDLIHTHSVFLWPTNAAARVARASEKPYVLSPRGMLVSALIERRSRWLKRAWIALFERRNVERAAAVHVTSGTERDELLAMGFHPRRLFKIANGVELDTGVAAPPEPGLPARYALFLGRISWKKGLDRLLDAIACVPAIDLVIAGNDEENLGPAMLARARDLGIADRVHFTGFVDGEHKRRILANARVMVLPSHNENFGNAVLEAMAAGVPVVVTPQVGIASLVERARAGIVAEATPATLAAAISTVLDDEKRRAYARNARAAALEHSWPSVALQMEEQYRCLVE